MAAASYQFANERTAHLVEVRCQLEALIELCRQLGKPWPNRDNSGKLVDSRESKTKLSEERKEQKLGEQLMCQEERDERFSTVSTTEYSTASELAPDLMEKLDKILEQAKATREVSVVGDVETKGFGHTQNKKGSQSSLKQASQVYSSSKSRIKSTSQGTQGKSIKITSKRTKQTDSLSSTKKSRGVQSSQSSFSNILSTNSKMEKRTATKGAGTKCYSEGAGTKCNNEGAGTKCYSEGAGTKCNSEGAGTKCKSSKVKQWTHLIEQDVYQSDRGKDTSPNYFDVPCQRNDEERNVFLLKIHGEHLSMPLKYRKLINASEKAIHEAVCLEHETDTSRENFIKKLDRLTEDEYSGNHGDRKCLIGLAVFQKKCEDLRMQLDNNKRQNAENIERRFKELCSQWESLQFQGVQRVTSQCQEEEAMPSKRQRFVYSDVREWLAYSKIKSEIEHLEWETKFLELCLNLVSTHLRADSSEREYLQEIQSAYHLFDLPGKPVFTITKEL